MLKAPVNCFSVVSCNSGKETYVALMELTNEYPYKDYTQWMMRAARNRALADADFECWTDKQVHDFDASLVFTPNSPAQLYQMGVYYLLDFKDWLERGNDSLAKTYQKLPAKLRCVLLSLIISKMQRRGDSLALRRLNSLIVKGQIFGFNITKFVFPFLLS